ncbi:hypothetical protein BTR23_07385 [Alkalihalophilus pseudofirmus]|nr:hypothetical protein BTR23_07385 [Alkalihalophilus pseudofirmus]
MNNNDLVLPFTKFEDVVLTPIPSTDRKFSNYLVDTLNGRIWSKYSNCWLSNKANSNGYVYACIFDDNGKPKRAGIHVLVIASFTGIPIEMFGRGKIEVDHYPFEKQKDWNSIHNLQMSDRKGQYRESTRRKMGKGKRLKEEDVCEIIEQLQEWKEDENNKLSDFIWMISEAYDLKYRTVWNIVYGKSWKHLHDEMAV